MTVLYRMAGSPSVVGKTCPFTDNTAAWSRDAITWAYSTGVAKGYTDTRFAGTDTVTREQLASFLYRYADTPKELQDKYIEACTNLTVAGGLGKLSFGPSVQTGSGLIK